MSHTKFFLMGTIVLISVSIGYFIGQSTKTTIAQTDKKSAETAKTCDLLTKIKEEKVSELTVLGDNGKPFYGVIRRVDESSYDDSSFKSSDKFSIYDDSGRIVYETKEFNLGNIQSVRFTNPSSREIMFETNGGGTDNFLKILDYKDGKFVEIIDESETQYRGGYFEMIQYRKEMKTPYFKPSQLVVIQQIGGADENPSAAVFRMKDNKFQKVGSIEMQKLGDFIEQQIARKD